MRDGKVITVTTGMLPEAEFAFLDELFNANSADSQQPADHPQRARLSPGLETLNLPLLSLFSASNHLPEEDSLRALFDRFMLRCHVDNLKRERDAAAAASGLGLERAAAKSVGDGGGPPASEVDFAG